VITKRKVHAIGGARGFWSLPIRQSVKSSGISYEKPMNPFQAENDTLLLSTDANPSPGFSRVRSFFLTTLIYIYSWVFTRLLQEQKMTFPSSLGYLGPLSVLDRSFKGLQFSTL
jgi:hypothetical protein